MIEEMDLDKEFEALERRLEALENDHIMRVVTALYKDRIRKDKVNMRNRYISLAAAKEKERIHSCEQ
jgi:hypothetical protein